MASDVTTPNPAATSPPANNETSLTGLVTGIIHDTEQLFKQQLALLKHEVREDMRKTAVAAGAMVAGAAVTVLGVLLLVLGVPLLLAWATDMPVWAWFLIVGAVITVAGLCLLYAGKKKFDSFNPLPNETAEALKENVQWIMKPK
jgi:hypothetical protein